MSSLTTHPDPRLTRRLVETRFREGPAFLIIDIGASGGIESHWKVLGRAAIHVAFEPDEAECRRLSQTAKEETILYFPVALAERTGKRTFYRRRFGAGSSFFDLTRSRENLLRFFPPEFVDDIVESEAIEMDVQSLDDFLTARTLPAPDFVKLDVERAEMEILRGGATTFDKGVFGACIEVGIDRVDPRRPSFADIDLFMQERGFRLFDMAFMRYGRSALPLPYTECSCDAEGRLVPGPTVRGKPQLADTLYLRDVVADLRSGERTYTATDILKACCIYEIYGFEDYAAELLSETQDRLVDEGVIGDPAELPDLLDLLVPPVRGMRLSYARHVRSFQEHRSRFYPERGRLSPTPDILAERFEGTFVPGWRRHLLAPRDAGTVRGATGDTSFALRPPQPCTPPVAFWVDSYGGTATKWLTICLNQLPDSICAHSHFWPPACPGRDAEQPESEIWSRDTVSDIDEFFGRMMAAFPDRRCYGVVHAFTVEDRHTYGLPHSCRSAYLMRHPVTQIDSILAQWRHRISVDGRFLERQIVALRRHAEKGFVGSNLPILGKLVATVVGSKRVEDCLALLAMIDLAESHSVAFLSTAHAPIFVMESLTSEPSTFATMVEYCTGGVLELAEGVAESAWNSPAVHAHRDQRKSPEEAFRAWPQWQRSLFNATFFNFFAPDYQRLGYDVSFAG